MLVQSRRILNVLTGDEELLDVGEAEVTGLMMLWHYDDRTFLALEDSVDAHLFFFSFCGLVSSIVLQHLQQ